MKNQSFRSTIFRHLDGIAITPVISILNQKGMLQYLNNTNTTSLRTLAEKFGANEGYLNVALRGLASQGFLLYTLDNNNDVYLSATEKLSHLIGNASVYEKVFPFLKASISKEFQNFELASLEQYTYLLEEHQQNFGLQDSQDRVEKEVHQEIITHLEGCLVGPIIVQLGMRGMFHKYFMESSFQAGEFHKNPAHFEKILDFLTTLGWFTKHQSNYTFTDKGEYFARRAPSYGVTVSYLPLLLNLDDLIFGDPNKLRDIQDSSDEIHVDRIMNVWGSGGAHANYFKAVTDFIIHIFNQPIERQPKGILDMGCGNGAFIQHMFETIERHTLRGKMLNEHPLLLVGADYNQAALAVTRENLIQNDIWAKIIWGDIGNPDQLAKDLKENYNIQLEDLLNTRTFLDHNRIWEDPKSPSDSPSSSTGAFSHRGRRLNNADVETNLQEHLEKWLPYIKKNGLLVIELHTLSPELTAQHLGETAATAYDITHGFSDQYIVELDVFMKIANQIGLSYDDKLFRRFPNSELATVSINLLKSKQ